MPRLVPLHRAPPVPVPEYRSGEGFSDEICVAWTVWACLGRQVSEISLIVNMFSNKEKQKNTDQTGHI